MFFFSKPKPSLADLIPDGYIDIHSHLVPGIDDGAKDPEDSTRLIRQLQEYGFSQFITTPHVLTGVWNNTRQGITETAEKHIPYLKEQGIHAPYKAAAEYLMDDTFLKLFGNEELLTIKDKYVLVEMSYLNPPMQLYTILFELQIAGYKPILAHPERYVFNYNNYAEYEKMKRAGCLFQINLLSVTGYYGKGAFEIGKKLLDDGMIDFAGSDAHHTRHVESFKNKVLLKETKQLETALKNNALFKI